MLLIIFHLPAVGAIIRHCSLVMHIATDCFVDLMLFFSPSQTFLCHRNVCWLCSLYLSFYFTRELVYTEAVLCWHGWCQLWLRPCSFVCHKSVLYENYWTGQSGFWYRWFFELSYTVLWGNFILVSPTIRLLSHGTLTQTLDLGKCCYTMLHVSQNSGLLSQWASGFVYHIMGVTDSIMQVRSVAAEICYQ